MKVWVYSTDPEQWQVDETDPGPFYNYNDPREISDAVYERYKKALAEFEEAETALIAEAFPRG